MFFTLKICLQIFCIIKLYRRIHIAILEIMKMSIFFEPWIGEKYADGIKFDNNIIKSGNRHDKNNKAKGFYKVMVLGKEHYCKTIEHCKEKTDEQSFYEKCLERINNSPKDQIKTTIYEIKRQQKPIPLLYEQLKNHFNKDEQAEWENIPLYKDTIWVLYRYLQKYKNNKGNIDNFIQRIFDILKLDFQTLSKKMGDTKNNPDPLFLYMAIEKFLSVHALWNKNYTTKTMIEEIIKIAQDNTKIINKGPCNMNTKNCSNCAQMHICKQMTKRELDGYISGLKEYDSHLFFRKAFFDPNDNVQDWNRLIFTNFFQQSMPKETGNKRGNETDAGIAIAEIIRTHKPDILITWSDDVFKYLIHNLPSDITARTRHCHPTLQIGNNRKFQTFTILTWKDKQGTEYECLVLMCYYHPSADQFKKHTDVQDIFRKYTHYAFQNYTNITSWKPTQIYNILEEIIDKCYNRKKMYSALQDDLKQYENRIRNDKKILKIFNKAKDANGIYTKLSNIRELIKNIGQELNITII